MLDDADGEDEIERPVGPPQPARPVVGEEGDLADGAEPQLIDLGPDDLHERAIGIEGPQLGHFRLLGQVLGQVAERAADFEHPEAANAAGA